MQRVLASLPLVILTLHSPAFGQLAGAFFLGIDAKVEAKVKVDQQVLDVINSLPIEVRKQAVIAMNQTFDRLDESVRSNSQLLGKEIERTSLAVSMQWECALNNNIEKVSDEIRGATRGWKIFYDACEKKYVPDKNGPSIVERLDIAACYVYEMPESTPPNVMSNKMAGLQTISKDAACRMRETPVAANLLKRSGDYSIRYLTWEQLKAKNCVTPSSCLQLRKSEVLAFVNASDTRDLGDARLRLSRSNTITSDPTCKLPCFEEALVQLYLTEQEVGRYRGIREADAKDLGKKARDLLAAAQKSADEATSLAGHVAGVGQVGAKVTESTGYIQASADAARNAIRQSVGMANDLVDLQDGYLAVATTLGKVPTIVQATNTAENARRQEEIRQLLINSTRGMNSPIIRF